MSHDSMPETSPVAQDTAAGFLERFRRLTATTASSLYDHYQEEDPAAFEETLEDLVFEIAFADPEYAANAVRLKSDRLDADEATRIAQKQRATIAEIKRIVIAEAGLPTEELATDIEKGQMAVKERLGDIDPTDATSDELLRKLGILVEDDKGGATFVYPHGLLPESIDEKWHLYISAVEHHMRVGRDVGAGLAPKEELGEADKVRRFTHNSVARDIDRILGLETLSKDEWDFEKTRGLVGKMRDGKYIGAPTAESTVTSQALARSLGLSVIGRLASRNKDD